MPGAQYTATTAALKEFAQKLIDMKDGEHGSKEMSRTVGGCSMNTSRSAHFYLQALCGEKSEGRVKTMGSIGDDENGKWIQSKLQEEKLAVDLLQVPNVLTGSCPVTVVEADRTCVAILDAGQHYKAEHFEQVLADEKQMENVKYLYTTGFFLSSQAPTCTSMAEYAQKFNKALCFNFASECLFEDPLESVKMLEMMKFCDFMFCNRQEAIAFA